MDNCSRSVWSFSLWRNLLQGSSLQFVTQVSLSLAVQNNESEQYCAGVSVCICAYPVKHQCPDQQTMGGNVLRVTDRPFGRFRPSTADSPLLSSQGAFNCVHNPALCQTCILIRTQTIWGCTHCSVHIKWAKSPFECHIALLFNEFSIVRSLAEVQPALNHTSLLSMVVNDEFRVSVTTWKSVCSAVLCRLGSILMEFRESKCC